MNKNLSNEGVSKHGRDHGDNRTGAGNRSCMRLSLGSRGLSPTNTCGIRTIQMTTMTWTLLGAEICQSSDRGVGAISCGEKYCINNVAVDSASETTSLNSSIFHYRHENGRRYHAYKDGEYWGPNDEKQNEQLDIAFVHSLSGDLLLALKCISKFQSSSLDPTVRRKASLSTHFEESSGIDGLLG
jgi:hypothetical protein